MKRLTVLWIAVILKALPVLVHGGSAACATADVAPLLEPGSAAAEMLTRHVIPVQASGEMALSFPVAVRVLARGNLLDDVQAAYAELLPEGEVPEFEVRHAESNHYFYVNAKQQRSDVRELLRRYDGSHEIEAVYYVTGKRFFGYFESVTHVRVTRAEDDIVAYAVDVFAYPHNGVSRFLARHLRLVERYFNDKTDAMVSMVADICRYLCRPSLASTG
jgi:hypothetical protein